jgi:ribosomal-protein-alanine N-acetyltransferase
MKTFEIETERLKLRPYTLNDIDNLHNLWTNAGVRKYLLDNIIITREQAEIFVRGSIDCFEKNGFGQCVVILKEKNSFIGFCGFRFFEEPPEVEILYGLYPEYWGKGLAAEAAKAMIRYGFEENKFEKILAGTDEPNSLSLRVIEKCGMKFYKKINLPTGVDTIYYELKREDFRTDDSIYILKKKS